MDTILVVDDESNMRFLLRIILERAGYEVVEAPHGVAALARAKESRPDLVVTDLMMPVMSGRELIDRLRADPKTAAIPIVVISTKSNAALAEVDAVLGKPFDPDAALAAVDAVLGKPFDPDALLLAARALAGRGGG